MKHLWSVFMLVCVFLLVVACGEDSEPDVTDGDQTTDGDQPIDGDIDLDSEGEDEIEFDLEGSKYGLLILNGHLYEDCSGLWEDGDDWIDGDYDCVDGDSDPDEDDDQIDAQADGDLEAEISEATETQVDGDADFEQESPGKKIPSRNNKPDYCDLHAYIYPIDNPDDIIGKCLGSYYDGGIEHVEVPLLPGEYAITKSPNVAPEKTVVIEAGKSQSVDFYWEYCDADKPNIYLYPEEPTQVDVTLDLCAGCYLKQSIPDYGTGWSVWAEPDGTLDEQYGYLFYEAAVHPDFSLREGWSVPGDEVMEFFADNLSAYGFNAQETADFVDYWRTHLPAAPYYAVFPLVQDALGPMAALSVSPEPDSVFRLWYVVYPRSQEDDLPEPEVAPMPRAGFVVTEWGVIVGGK